MIPLIAVLITLVLWGLVFYFLWWGLGTIALPEPWNKAAVVVLVIASIIVVIGVLTGTIAPFPFLSSFTR